MYWIACLPLLKLHPDVTAFQLNSKGAWATCFIKVKFLEQVQDDQSAQQCSGEICVLGSSGRLSVTAASLSQWKHTPSDSSSVPHKAAVMAANPAAAASADLSITLLLRAPLRLQPLSLRLATGSGQIVLFPDVLFYCDVWQRPGQQRTWLDNHMKSMLRFGWEWL